MVPRERVAFRLKMTRLAVAGAAVLLTLATLRLAWGGVAAWRLAQARGALVKLGVFQGERSTEELPEAENGAAALVAAIKVFDPMGFRGPFGVNQGATPAMWDLAWTPEEREGLKKIVTANARVLELLDGAGRKSDWTTGADAQAMDGVTVSDRSRLMVDLLLTAALVHHREGQDGTALRMIGRVLTIERILTASPTVVAHAAVILIRARVVAMIERIGPTLKIASGGAAGGGDAGAALPAEMQGIIAGLLDDRAFHRQLGTAMEFQMEQVDSENWGGFRGELGNWWLLPLKADERRRAMQSGAYWLPLARSTTYEPLRNLPEFRRRTRDNLTTVVFAATSGFDVQWSLNVRQHFRGLADGGAAAVILAARWAQVAEDAEAVGGERLVPTYLPAAPVDPFAADGRPLRYRLDADGITVWSVGANGEDDSAVLSLTPRARAFDEPDLVYGAAWRRAVGGAPAP